MNSEDLMSPHFFRINLCPKSNFGHTKFVYAINESENYEKLTWN